MKIIAEVGSNWHTHSDLFHSIECAKEDGASAVKFQYFTAKELYGFDAEAVDKYSVPLDVMVKLKAAADHVGIEFMCSAFSIKGYEEIDPLVKTHKIASSEGNWPHLLELLTRKDKPVIVSTGGLLRTKIKSIVDFQTHTGNDYYTPSWRENNLTLLYCDPTYPSNKSRDEIIEGIEDLRSYGVDVGLSDHSLFTNLGHGIINKISVVEKHYNPFDLKGVPDEGHSLNRKDFFNYADSCRTLGGPEIRNKHARVKTKDGWFRPYYGNK